MKILVTGGAGYIGALLCGKLLEEGWEVTIIEKFEFGASSIYHYFDNPNFSVVKADAYDVSSYLDILNKCDVFIPLAALVGASLCDAYPSEAERVNLHAIEKAIKYLRPDQQIIYPNTNSGYGATTGEQYCDEATPMQPISIYGKTKLAAEGQVLSHSNSVVFRLATVFGVSTRPRYDLIVNNFVMQAVLNKIIVVFQGNFMRNYVHVLDVVDAFIFAIKNSDKLSKNIYNLGNDHENCSKLDLARKIQHVIPEMKILEGSGYVDQDKRNYIVSSDKLRVMGFESKRSILSAIPGLCKQVRHIDIKNGNY